MFGALSCKGMTWPTTFSHPSFGFVCLKLINMLTVGGKKKSKLSGGFYFSFQQISKV